MKCHYCFGHGGTEHDDCNAEMYGPAVECQMQNPTLPYFGDVCLVAHTGKITFSHLMKMSDNIFANIDFNFNTHSPFIWIFLSRITRW